MAKYHVKEQPARPEKRLLITAFGVFLLALGVINAYGLWMKYRGAEPAAMILLRSLLLLVLSVLMIRMGVNGPERRAYLKLKDYFSQTGVKSIGYQICDSGIHLLVSGTDLFYSWDRIEHIQFDSRFFYISSGGRHSILDKRSLDADQTACFEALAGQKQVPFKAL